MTPTVSSSGSPRGLEVLLKKAAVDGEFRRLLLERREAAAGEIALSLTPPEQAMLRAMPAGQLEAIIDRTEVDEGSRRAFLGRAAAAMLAALGAVAGEVVAGTGADGGTRSAGTFGNLPDRPPVRPAPDPEKPVSPPRPMPDPEKPVSPPQRPPWDRSAAAVDKFGDGDGVCKLTCEMVGLPAEVKAGSKLSARVQIGNPTAEPVKFVALCNRTGVSAGTGVGLEFCRAAGTAPAGPKPDEKTDRLLGDSPADGAGAAKPPEATPAPEAEQVPVPTRPPFINKPDDILSVVTAAQVAAGAKIIVPVSVRVPEQAGDYQVRAFVRSWAYAAPSADTKALDAKAVQERFIKRCVGEARGIRLTAPAEPVKTPVQPPPPPPRLDRLPAAGGARPDLPQRPVGGVGGGLIP